MNTNILNFIVDNPILDIKKIGDSILVRGKSDHTWVYISSTYEDELRILAKNLDDNDKYFAAIEKWMVPILTENKEVVWNLSMIQFILPKEAILPKPKYEIMFLSLEDATRVYENSNYKVFISIEYIKDRIIRGTSVAIYEENQLVAWAMTQDDGAMGFLHVLESYRNRGYGYNISLALIEELRKKGKTPFAYIEEDNRKAINLVSKLDFRKDKMIHWFQTK
ncbi:GNAT family N-acetyltransferase [Caldithrix abyssi]|nr:GNAT family N-acetyltransferase [Caldithrix abyssi]